MVRLKNVIVYDVEQGKPLLTQTKHESQEEHLLNWLHKVRQRADYIKPEQRNMQQYVKMMQRSKTSIITDDELFNAITLDIYVHNGDDDAQWMTMVARNILNEKPMLSCVIL